ncbi:MAG: sensor histidine kinase [Chloroflexota bacterium]
MADRPAGLPAYTMHLGFDPADPILPVIVWAARALTFFNVLVLLWLGLTVLLNADRRRLGAWLTGGGLVLGGLCSILRAAAQATQAAQPVGELAAAFEPADFWWRLSWLPFAGAVYLWSVVLIWHAGRLQDRAGWLRVAALTAYGVGVFVLLVTARAPDEPAELPGLPLDGLPIVSMPFAVFPNDAYLALAAYLTFGALCIQGALRALYHPGSRDRFMGELAFRRARPWLTVTSVVALASSVVGIGVTGVPLLTPWALVDLLGALLLAAHVVLLGQAVVSYEVFTGKTLPRRGLARYWRNALILAAGFGGLLAVSLGLPLDQSYRLTLSLVVVAVFYALLSWRSFVERERSLEQLRPFVASEHLVEHLLAREHDAPTSQPRTSSVEDGGTGTLLPLSPRPPLPRAGEESFSPVSSSPDEPFRALCRDLLGARVGYLCPVGTLASLVGEPVAAPADALSPAPQVLAALTARVISTRQLCLPVEPAQHAGAAWAIPLWGERGLIGLLLLGEKRDGSLYTQEEMEIARAAGERLVDARAAGELARRLLLLQRKRLADDYLVDGRVRRTLHDDVLPLLHTALLTLASQPPVPSETPDSGASTASTDGPSGGQSVSPAELLSEAHRLIAGLLADLPQSLTLDLARTGLLGALQRTADDLRPELDGVEWQIDDAGKQALAALPPLTADVLFGAAREALRNVVRHGRAGDGSRRLHLWIAVIAGGNSPGGSGGPAAPSDELVIRIQDDGVGLHGSAHAGTADTQGNGQGLLLHGTLLTVIGGSLVTESAPGQGTRVTLRVPCETAGRTADL